MFGMLIFAASSVRDDDGKWGEGEGEGIVRPRGGCSRVEAYLVLHEVRIHVLHAMAMI